MKKFTLLNLMRATFCLALLAGCSYGLYGHFERNAIAEAKQSAEWHPCKGPWFTNCDWSTPPTPSAPDYAQVWYFTSLSLLGIIVVTTIIAYIAYDLCQSER